MTRALLYITLLLTAISCSNNNCKDTLFTTSNQYAKELSIEEQDGYTVIDIRNPWDTLTTLQRYIAVPKGKDIPDSIPQGVIIRTPIERIVTFTALHASVINELGAINSIVGMCDTYYTADSTIKSLIANNTIVDLGDTFAPNIERIISLNPEAIIISPYKGEKRGAISQLGIPLIEVADYMEQTPLARTEWVKLFGILFNSETKADSIFEHTKQSYNRLTTLTDSIKDRPTLFCERKTGNVWYQAGGESYAAKLYSDAGINYLWSNTKGSDSLPLSFEEVLHKASNANLWLLKYSHNTPLTISDLEREYAPYCNFNALKNGAVWGCNGLKTTYYEEIMLHPDRVLRDLILIAHPNIFTKTDTTRFFKQLK